MKKRLSYIIFLIPALLILLGSLRHCEQTTEIRQVQQQEATSIALLNAQGEDTQNGFEQVDQKQDSTLSFSTQILQHTRHLDSLSKDTISQLKQQIARQQQENSMLAKREQMEARSREQMTWVLRNGQEDIIQSIQELKAQVDTLQQKNARLQSLLSDSTRFSQKIKVQIEDSIVRQLQKDLFGYTQKNQSLDQTLKQIQQSRKPAKLKKIKRKKVKVRKKPNPDG